MSCCGLLRRASARPNDFPLPVSPRRRTSLGAPWELGSSTAGIRPFWQTEGVLICGKAASRDSTTADVNPRCWNSLKPEVEVDEYRGALVEGCFGRTPYREELVAGKERRSDPEDRGWSGSTKKCIWERTSVASLHTVTKKRNHCQGSTDTSHLPVRSKRISNHSFHKH